MMLISRVMSKNSFLTCRKYVRIINSRHIHYSYTLYLRRPALSKRSNAFSDPHQSSASGILQPHEKLTYVNTNFYGIEGDEGVIHVEEVSDGGNMTQNTFESLKKPKSEFRSVSFGAVRLDSENKPSYYARVKNVKNSPEKQSHPADENIRLHVNQTELKENYNQSNFDITEDNSKDFKYSDKNNSFYEKSFKNPSVSYVDADYFPEDFSKLDKNSINNEQKFDDLNVNNNANFPQCDSFIQYKTSLIHSENNAAESLSFEKIQNIIDKHEQSMQRFTENPLQSNTSTFEQNNLKSKEPVSYIDECFFDEEIAESPVEQSKESSSNFIEEKFFNENEPHQNTEPFSLDKSHALESNLCQNEIIKKFNNLKKNAVVGKNFSKNNLQKVAIEEEVLSRLSREKLKHEFKNNKTFETTEMPSITFQKQKHSFDDALLENRARATGTNLSTHNNFNRKSSIIADQINKDTKPKILKNIKENSTLVESVINSSVPSEDKVETAYDFVKQLREKQVMSDIIKKGIAAKKEKKLDSKGFRILKHQVPSLKYFTRDEILELLTQSVLYSDDDIVVLNKPYNLVMHESSTSKENVCLSKYLKDLAEILDKDKKSELFTLHRLDKETTGCLLLAKNRMAAEKMKILFAQRKILKTYWIVTINVPDPLEGIIDIPISEGIIDKKTRMVLHPDLPDDVNYVNHSKSGKRAITSYSVIATSGNAALVEIKPETGIKHQIRVHFGFGLDCPILGDHKYSHLNKLAPQKLPSDMLQKLQVRQSKVRHIPMHIHSKHILIPQYLNEKNLFITAPLPKHMVENLRSLKFKKK